jgi:hypothetical protein
VWKLLEEREGIRISDFTINVADNAAADKNNDEDYQTQCNDEKENQDIQEEEDVKLLNPFELLRDKVFGNYVVILLLDFISPLIHSFLYTDFKCIIQANGSCYIEKGKISL